MADSIIYCIKCKKKTDTNDPKEDKSTNGAKLLKGTCHVCNSKKSKILAKAQKSSSPPLQTIKEVKIEEPVKPLPKKRKSKEKDICV